MHMRAQRISGFLYSCTGVNPHQCLDHSQCRSFFFFSFIKKKRFVYDDGCDDDIEVRVRTCDWTMRIVRSDVVAHTDAFSSAGSRAIRE